MEVKLESDPMRFFFEDERTAIFIDGSNLYSASRNLGFDVDYKALHEFFATRCDLVTANYYSAILDNDDYSPLKPLIDWLAYNGYSVVSKAAKEFTDATGRRRVKGNMDIEIAVDMLEMSSHVRHVVLFSGDSDFRYLVETVQRKGVKVTVISTHRTTPAMIGDELRRQASRYIDIVDIKDSFTRRHTEQKMFRGRNEAVEVQ